MQRTTSFWIAMALGVTPLVGACSGAAGGVEWAGTMRDSAGVQIVENPATGIWAPDKGWRLEEDLRIGTAEGEPEYQFGAVAAIAVDNAGTIYALDQQGQHIVAYDSTGHYLRTIGRGGSGLGELSPGVGGLALLTGDTLMVIDQGNARFAKFLTDGTPAGTFRIDVRGTGIPFRIVSDPHGGVIAQMRKLPIPGLTPDSLDRIVHLASDGTPTDTLLSVPSGRTIQVVNGAPRWEFFSPEPLWNVRPGGLVSGINNEYRFALRNAAGDVEQIVTKPFTPREVSEDHADRMREAIIEIARRQAGRPLPPQAIQMMRTNMHFAEHYPVMGFISAGPDSTIWIQQVRSVADLSEDELANFNIQLDLASPNWDVFDSEGRYLGAVTMPGRIQLFAMKNGHFYGVMRDDLDVQYVVRLKLVKPA